MSTLMGYEFFGTSVLSSDLPPINSIYRANMTDGVYDELMVRESVDSSVDTTNTKQVWQTDTRLDAKFEGSLEAGNINNQGVQISNIIIKRRVSGDTNNLQIGSIPFVSGQQVNYTDVTQPVGDFVYQIVPLGENGMEGKPNEVSATSDFYGWWIVDKDTNKTFQFDLTLDGQVQGNVNLYGTVQTQLNQGRTVIETLSQYPQIYYTDMQYHSFDIQAAIAPSNYSWDDYQILLNMITSHKPLIVKAGSGDIYVADIYSPQKVSLLNAYKKNEYAVVQVSVTEVQDYNSFMTGS